MKTLAAAALPAALALSAVPGTAQAWDGAHWAPNTCGAALISPAFQGNWWVRVSDESGTLAESSSIPAKSYPASSPLTIGGLSHDGGVHVVKYEAANAANHRDGYISYSQTQWNCVGSPGPAGPTGPPGPPGVGYDCTGQAIPTGGTPAMCLPPAPKPASCKSTRVYRVKVAARFRGERITGARLTWANGHRHTLAVRRSDGRLHAAVSFRGITSPIRGLWAVTMRINFDGGKHATLTRNVRLCAPSDGNLNFATDVHRDGS